MPLSQDYLAALNEIAKEIASSLALFIDHEKVSSGCMSTTINQIEWIC